MLKLHILYTSTTALILLLFIAILSLSGCTPDTEDKPDIVLITLDTTRWDYLHSYEYELPNTPNLDKLAKIGSRYLKATTVAGTTFPAHGSMLTGLYPRRHGARSNFFGLNNGVDTVAQILTAHDYQTGSFVSFKGMHSIGHLDRGFQAASDRKRSKRDKKAIRPGNETLAMATDWLASTDTKKPMFLWMHLFEPHGPYDPTPWFNQHFPEYSGPFKNGVNVNQIHANQQEEMTASDLEAMRHIYAGEIALADQYVGELIASLKKRGKLNNTLLIIAADHGQGMGENAQFGHGALLWESILHVPLIIVDFRDPKPAVVEQRVGLVDITPTILDAASIEIPTTMAGRSLFPLENPANGKDRLYYSEVKLLKNPDKNSLRWYDATDLAVYMDDYKLIHRKGKYKLFTTSRKDNSLSRVPIKKAESLFYYLHDSASSYLENAGKVESQTLDDKALKELQGLGYTQ